MADDNVERLFGARKSDHLPTTRAEAKRLVALNYFTGIPCKNGHVDIRVASNGQCAGCNRARLSARWAANRKILSKERRESYAADPTKRLAASNNYYKKNKDTVLGRRLAAYASHPEPIREEARKFRAKHAIRIAATKRERYAKDPSKWKAATKKWQQSHPEAVAALEARHRAKKLGAEGSFSQEDIARIRKSQKDRCGFCRRKLTGKGHIDHITALTKGSSNWPNNLQILCASCNTSKSNRDQIEFAKSRGLLL